MAPVPVPRAAWEETLAGAAPGAAYAALLCKMYDGINAGQVRFSGEGAARRGAATARSTKRCGAGQLRSCQAMLEERTSLWGAQVDC
ncbi:MAG: hypothetical protein B7Y43_07065 [Sphingomonas sp. 28-62-20]|nr:MAG: hypothetical protein B7Y43_07065 [Sphingomonas sp. 28-62-20]